MTDGFSQEVWEEGLKGVETLAGHAFRDFSLLVEAMTHASFSNEKETEVSRLKDNERLEFLGDAVIGLVVGELLMKAYPAANEGDLSQWRSTLVSRKVLADIALEFQLGRFIRFGVGESKTGGAEKRSILAGAFEAMVGALYQDAGLTVASRFLEGVFSSWIAKVAERANPVIHDNKTELQEVVYLQFKQVPIYQLDSSWGPEHAKTFRVSVSISGLGSFFGEGRSKKEAEQAAAGKALQMALQAADSPVGSRVQEETPPVTVTEIHLQVSSDL